jgi:hypothetical protein
MLCVDCFTEKASVEQLDAMWEMSDDPNFELGPGEVGVLTRKEE